MAFQIKNFTSIVASLINLMKSSTTKITDFTEGSIARTIVEAPAAEMEELYLQMYLGLKDAIPVATYNSFNFGALPAISASGTFTVTITAQTVQKVIGAGSVTFTSPSTSTSFTSSASVTIPAGNTVAQIPVVATSAGASTNVPAGISWSMSPQPNGFVSATNVAAFINGADAESPDQRQTRFAAYIQSLERGTVQAIEYGLSTVQLTDSLGNITERVASSAVFEPWLTDNTQPISLVNFYIHNGVGNTSSNLLSLANQVIYGYTDASGNKIPGWKAAGVKVQGYIATEVSLSIGGTLTAAAGYAGSALGPLANAAASNYIIGLGIGASFQVDDLIVAVKAVPGVGNYVPADILPPAAPALGSSVGGALGSATYYVKTTYVTPFGETLASSESSLAVAANSVLTVGAAPAIVAGVTGWNVYVGTAAGAETLQNASPIALGTGWLEPTSGLIAGSAIPAVSTARLADISILPNEKFMPGTMSIA